MHVLENQYIILFFASLILKSMGKLLNFSEIRKGYHKPVNQDWQDIGRVFRDRSLPFATSTPLSWASLTTSSLSWCLHMDLLPETEHPMSQPRVLPIPSIKPQRPGLYQKLLYSFSSGGPVLCGGNRIF